MGKFNLPFPIYCTRCQQVYSRNTLFEEAKYSGNFVKIFCKGCREVFLFLASKNWKNYKVYVGAVKLKDRQWYGRAISQLQADEGDDEEGEEDQEGDANEEEVVVEEVEEEVVVEEVEEEVVVEEVEEEDAEEPGGGVVQEVDTVEVVVEEEPGPVRMLNEELQLLQEPGSYVGEVVRVLDKSKVLVKVHLEEKYVVDIDKNIDITKLSPSTRVALRHDTFVLHLVLPSKVDPLVNLMKVEKVPDTTYDMIGGLDQQIEEMKEVIELPIEHPDLFESLGIAQPKGVLLYGPPGTGKTLVARALAHHTNCTFIRVSCSELVQKYIGEGSRMVRELFVKARNHAPSIIFMDEIDSIGSARMESGSGSADSEVQRTMLELLNQLDGFEASNKIKVLMATNRIDMLDQALLRPGRIDRKIEFPNPNAESRWGILKIHSRKMNLMRGIDLKKIAEKMSGASGAELEAVCTEAGMFALRERRVHVTQEDYEMAVAKVMKQDDEKNLSLTKL